MAQYSGKQYSAKEKQAYHNKMAKKGAKKTVKDPNDPSKKIKKNVSDFERGVHKAKADMICKARQRAWRKGHQSN